MNSIIITDKKRPGGLRGNEKINVEDTQLRLWEATLNEINGLTGPVVKVGEITYEDLNALGSSTELEIVLEDAKPADKILIASYIKLETPFVSYSYGYDENSITNIQLEVEADSQISGDITTIPNSTAKDITITLTLNTENLQDWQEGQLNIYLELKRFPTLD